jgi:anti-sigma factor RsiW
MTELSDELLVAYVDGQLARKQLRAVEKVLDQDDVLAARVEALKHAHSRLEAAFEAILAGEELDVSAASAPEPEGLVIQWRTVKLATAAIGIVAALALVAVGYGWPLALPGPESWSQPNSATSPTLVVSGWQEEVTRAQALLGRESLEVGLDSQANPDFVAFQLAQILGAELKLPNLEPQGFRFVRAQVLRFAGEPLAQILYLGAQGAPLALYAKKGKGSAALLEQQYGSIDTVTWSEDGVSYLLAGQADRPLLMRIATKVKLEPAPPPATAPKPRSPVNGAFDKPL